MSKKHTQKVKNNWILDSKNIFLTYSRCSMTKEEINDYFVNFFEEQERKITYMLITSEEHEDQEEKGRHIHVFCQINKRIRTRSELFFDIKKPQSLLSSLFKTYDPKKHDRKDYFYHPHTQDVYDTVKVRDYLLKVDEPIRRGDILEYGEFKAVRYIKLSPEEEETDIEKLVFDEFEKLSKEYIENKINFRKAIREIKIQLKEFARSINRKYAYYKVNKINQMVDEYFYKEIISDKEFIYPFWRYKRIPIILYLINWIKEKQSLLEIDSEIRFPAIAFEGDSKAGKTKGIKSLFKHLKLQFNYIKDDINIVDETYDEDALVNIFDDISLKDIRKVNMHKSIIGGQKGATVNVKYKPKRTIKGAPFGIFLCNDDISFFDYCVENQKRKRKEYKYFRKNIIFFNLNAHQVIYYDENDLENKIVIQFEIPSDWNGKLYYTQEEIDKIFEEIILSTPLKLK